jgi:hypothetical protein
VDNAICVFGERKKSHDKVYPKGYAASPKPLADAGFDSNCRARYVEMLEQQQSQLVAGIREMYKKLLSGESWPGSPLQDGQEGHPLTHDILERLDVLHMTGDNPVKSESFEDDLSLLQERLIEGGASYVHHHRQGSVSSDSEPGLAHTDSPHGTPVSQSLSSFSDSYPPRRKRSSPHTPPHTHTNRMSHSSKRKHHQLPELQQQETESIQLWQEPWVMQSPEMANVDGNFFNSTYDAMDMCNPLSVNPLTAPTLSNFPQGSMGGWPSQDPDFDLFMRSGYHANAMA